MHQCLYLICWVLYSFSCCVKPFHTTIGNVFMCELVKPIESECKYQVSRYLGRAGKSVTITLSLLLLFSQDFATHTFCEGLGLAL
jgi:hypothetical protein